MNGLVNYVGAAEAGGVISTCEMFPPAGNGGTSQISAGLAPARGDDRFSIKDEDMDIIFL